MPAQPLSIEQLADASRLKALFQNWQRAQREAGRPSSQEVAAEQLGFGQSALAQYLNGKIPLNLDAGLKFAKLLDVHLADFSAALAEQSEKIVQELVVLDEAHISSMNRYRAPSQQPAAESAGADVTPISAHMVLITRDEHQQLLADQAPTVDRVNAQERRLLSVFRSTNDDGRRLILEVLDSVPIDVAAPIVDHKS